MKTVVNFYLCSALGRGTTNRGNGVSEATDPTTADSRHRTTFELDVELATFSHDLEKGGVRPPLFEGGPLHFVAKRGISHF